MKLDPTAIPQGTRTYLFDAAANKRYIEQTLHSVMRSRGFQEIVTPPIEYYESMGMGLNEDERNRIIRFTEGDSGRIVALRADITSQVARSAATHLLKRPFPLRLCYTGQVFRKTRTGKGEQYVVHQCGMEIMGASEPSEGAGAKADIEIIRAIAAGLDAVSIKDYSLCLGHAGIVASLVKEAGGSHKEEIKRALDKKDKPALKGILDRCGASKASAGKILSLTELHGGREALERAGKICTDDDSQEKLRNLTGIYNALESSGLGERLNIDIGETRGFGYYTGVTMELFSSAGTTLGTGGRYDNLVKRFGPHIPAVGFAFDIDMMINAIENLEGQGSTAKWRASDILLIGSDDETAEIIRQAGMMVIKPLDEMSEKAAIEYAQKMNIPHILIKGSGEEYDWINTAIGEKVKTSISDFASKYFK